MGKHTIKSNSLKTFETGITASITQTQGNGALTAHINVISTVANTDDTVTFPTAIEGEEVSITNLGDNTLQLFPNTSDDLGNDVNISMKLEVRETIEFFAIDDTTWIILNNSENFHGSMYDEDNSTEFVIHAQNEVHAYHSAGMVAGDLGEWTFNAGSAGASVTISSIADDTGGNILVTTGSTHGITVGDTVCHTAVTDSAYTGFFTVLTVPTTTTYTVTATFGVTRTGFVDRPAYLTPNDIAIGFHYLEWISTLQITGSNVTLAFHLHDELTSIIGSKSGYKFGSSSTIKQPGGLGEKTIVSGNRVFFTVLNETDATNITLKHFKMRVEHI